MPICTLVQPINRIEAAVPEVFVLDVISDTGEDDPSISLYRRSEDIDLSSVKVIEIATTLFSIPQENSNSAVAVNKKNLVITEHDNGAPSPGTMRLCY